MRTTERTRARSRSKIRAPALNHIACFGAQSKYRTVLGIQIMSITSEPTALAASSTTAESKGNPGLFNITYVCASAIVMVGWCVALTLGAISLARWLFS
jgi:hypothetical protein